MLDQQSNNLEFTVIDIKKGVDFYDPTNKKIPVLKNSQIKKEMLVLINDMMKPLFEQMLGKMGNGIEFFLYNNKDAAGNRIIDPTQPNSFKVEVKEEVFRFQLPLVSLMKEKECPVNQEKFSGNYIYCPIHGNKL